MIDEPRPHPTFALLLSAVALGLALCGCAPDSAQGEQRFGALNQGFPLQLRGWDGEQFSLATAPLRVLPLNASASDALVMLVDPERVAALPFTTREYSTIRDDRERWLALPEFQEISASSLLALHPDLIVTHEWQGASAVPYLRRGGVPVLVLPMPKSLQAACDEVLLLGQILGEERRAAAVVADVERRKLELANSAAGRKPLRVLGYSNYGTGGWAAGAGTTVDIVIALAGLRNAALDAELTNFEEIDYELLLHLDPDLILVESQSPEVPGPTETLLVNESALASLRALENGGLVRMPRRLSATTSFRMIEAAEVLARAADEWRQRQKKSSPSK